MDAPRRSGWTLRDGKSRLICLALGAIAAAVTASGALACDAGHSAYEARDYAAAVSAYSDCIDRADTDGDVVYRKGRSLMKLGRLDEAKLDLQSAIDIDPGRADLHNTLAWTHYLGGDHEAARTAIEVSLTHKPDDRRALDTKAHILSALGDVQGAMEAFDASVRLQPPAGVEKVEARLKAIGLDPGPVDGVYDERTREALAGCARTACNIWQ